MTRRSSTPRRTHPGSAAAVLALASSVAIPGAPIPVSAQAPTPTADLVQHLEWRNIGPANMAGRVTDIEAVEGDFTRVVVASASGGLWRSDNAGTTWEAIAQDLGTGSMGDLAIFQPDPDIMWVGTGESCTRNSVGWGDGVYRTTDGGRTWVNVGLRDTHHIGEVLTHPVDPDIAYVAAQGHLWGHSGERGLFKTVDGGVTWTQLAGGLPEDGRTGATDLVMDPTDPNTLYVAMWERVRQPHSFESGGPNGGIFKSTDAGTTWTRLQTGLPEGPVGKIGLAVYRGDPRILMAIVEHGYQPPPRVNGRDNPEYSDLSRPGTGVYRSDDAGASWRLVNRYNNRPFYYSHIWIDPNDDQRVFVLAGSANVSTDGGRTFERTLQGISGDFHALWVDPASSERFYVGNDKGAYVTFDDGHTFTMFDNMDIGQFYAVTVDNRDPYWVYGGLQDNGNWGGPSNSRDWNGVLNDHWFKFHAGDGFHTTVDPNDWRTVYTESQGGNIRRLDAVFRQQGKSITPTPSTILNLEDTHPGVTGDRLPRDRFRFNWSAPLRLSPHDSRVLWFGGNHLFRSVDRGDTWTLVSPDLSTADPVRTNPESGGLTRDVTGAETNATILTISESPITPGVVWIGTDDGNVQLTRDGGATWSEVGRRIPEVPQGLWVSRVEASRFAEGTAYVSIDGHRSDRFEPWIFRTRDYGDTWEALGSGLPDGWSVYVVREDPRNPNLLYAGTEQGAFASVDGGASWARLGGLPTVAVHDLVVHPRDGDLIAATHGRSVWILDDLTALQQFTPEVAQARVHLFRNRTATLWKGISRGATRGHRLFQGRNPLTIAHQPPGNSPSELENSAALHYYLSRPTSGPVRIEVESLDGEHRRTLSGPGDAGIHRVYWDLRFEPTDQERRAFEQRREQLRQQFGGQIPGFFGNAQPRGALAPPGSYTVTLVADGERRRGLVTVREDPEFARVPMP